MTIDIGTYRAVRVLQEREHGTVSVVEKEQAHTAEQFILKVM
jgi:uncharacterized membrane protein